MSSLILLNDLRQICAELSSDKVTNRNKALEKFDNILTISKDDLIKLYRTSTQPLDPTWGALFNSAVDAAISHSVKVQQAEGTKTFQTLRNKNFLYDSIINRLIDYSIENDNNFLRKSHVLTSFFDGFRNRIVVKNFGKLFLQILERGIYDSLENTSDLKVDELRNVLTYLFEINIPNDDSLKLAVMRCINKTLELSQKHVQLGSEINDYFDEIKSFAIAARDDPEKGEVIKMYYLFVSELSIDFHISTCKQIQEILPMICGYYNYRMKTESKTFLFSSVSISLTTIYPNLNTGDYNTIGISLNDDWLKTLRKLMTIVEVEAKEQAIQFQRPTTTKTDACLNIFIKMSGMIVFLINWGNNEQEEAIETRTKMSRNSDYIDTIVASTMNESKTSINQIWMEIFTELITTQPHLINLSNYITVLKSHERALQLFNCWQNLKCLRLSFYTLLKLEEKLFPKENTKTEKHIWSNIVEFLITDTSSHSDILREKHLLLQQLIRAKKSTIDDCLTLLNFILSNNSMRRNECISTICEMMRYNQCCNLDKTSEIISKLLNWLHQSCNKIDGKNLLLNVELLNENLVAETSALMVINFLDAHSHSAECISEKLQSNENLLNYKYCRKYICIEEHGKQQKKVKNTSWNEKPKRCMIQNNYELLMRLLNFEISKEANISSINVDLLRLLKMVLLLRKFFDYEIFDESTYMTCPLIKRIGVFFDNVDFHLKSIFVYQISRSEILETIQSLLEIFENICVCKPFLEFLSKQSIEGLIAFAGSILRQCDTSKSEDSKELSLITLKLLATICSSPAHSEKAFSYIKQQRLSTKENISGILSITKIFCAQNQNQEIASWFIGKLKTICQLYHMNVVISEQIIDIISEIVRYVEYFAEELQNAFVIISSFLKKAYKKFYSTQFVVKLIQSIRQITKYCPNLIVFEDFVSICLSCGKFLSSPNIAITFSVIKTVTSLMDPNWVVIDAANTEMYFNFCCKLYSSLVWSSFSMENEDYKKNSIGITIQLLTSIFAFSSYHRELAFQELGKYYAAQELTESNFYQFGQIGAYYNCSLFDFTKPYVDALLNVWCEKKQPMTSFPHFLCAKERIEFFSSYLPNICYYQLRFSPVEGLEELQLLKYGRKPQIIWKAVPVCYAYLLSFLSENTQHPSGSYIIEANNLLRTLKESGRDLLSVSYKIYWSTIYMATKQLWDECHFSVIFGFNLFCNTPRLCINLSSYKHNLRFYLQKCYSCPCSLNEGVNMLLQSDPMILLKVFAAFKFESSVFVFLGDKLKAFYWFCALAEIMINAVSEQFEGSAINNTQTFFLRDILFFILNTIGNKEVECEILRAGLYFMYYLLDKNISTFGDIILKHLSDIVCVVVSITQSREPSTITEMAINILELILCQHTLRFSESLKLLDEFPDSNIYQNLRNAQHDINKSKSTDLKCVIKDFLNTPTKGSVGLKSLKQSIADKKYELLSEDVRSSNALYDLLKQLIEIIRADDINLAIESAKCLGEIGSIKVGDISFYFECDTTFYNMESEYQNEIEFFAASLYRTLDKLLLKYDSASNSEVYAVCKDLANSKFGSKVIGVFPLFTLFLEQGRASILDQYSSISPFDFIEILKQHEHFEFNDWIKAFSSSVFRQCQWETFAELCELNLTFSESSIIPIIKILVANRQTHFDNVVAMLKQFFSRVYDTLKDEKWKTTRNIYSDKRVIKYFLNVCECIRIHNNWNLPIDILHVAKACIYCQAYFMGIMYLELWALEEKDKPKIKNAEIIRNPIFQEIATQAFKSIDCVEGISGFLDPVTSRLEYLNLEEDWSQVLLEIDASKDSDRNLYAQNLKRNGLLTLSCSNKFNSRTDYECCWRLGQWDTAVESNSHIGTLNDLEYEFEKNHFNALKSIYNREEVNCMSAIDKARQSIISMLKEISIECLQSIYKYLTWLHLLQQAEDFCQIQFALGTNTERVLQKWNLDQDLKYGNFNCTELVLSHQIALYKTAGIRAGRKINEFFKDKNAIGECIIKCIYECKSSGNMNLAIRNITLLRNIETSEQLKAKASIEDADICWKTGKSRMAKEILHNVMLNKDFVYCLERIQAHRMYGELLLETNNETFDVVYEEFFVRTFELLKKYSEHRDRILKSSSFDANEFETFNKESQKQTYETIAKYADKEYMQMDTYLNSETFRTKVQIMMKNKEEAQTLARQTKDRDKSIGINVMLRNYNIDDKEIKLLQATRSDNLCIAMENYIQFCKLDDVITSPAIYRIIALWFANKHDKKLHDKIKELIHDIPSFKFLCVLNQMSARLSSKNPLFLELLENVLVKCIEDHPHHTLHKILALVFAYADNPKSNTSSDRVDIAKNIINKARNKLNQNCIKQMELMFLALIDFANKDAGKNVSLILSDKIRKLKMLDNVQCPTMDLPISVSKEYTLTYIRKWDENVGLVGGINAPKKLMCVCSDGIARPQLLKGKDDLRQDAVMQQVLSMVNELLKIDPETNDQKLQLRTYRIVPLSMRSGILEWCKNTVPLGLYLCGDKKVEGAHKKYRPNDYTVAKCRNISMDAMKNQDFEKRHQTYLHICEKIKPVFHYFFFEKFLIPGIWFERRLAYTKSVATTSIVGYILGLGDRHVQNILIDELTAEVIHIDFGIAFEQGKIMPTPETVPFRLTRDIVAPMGISEADGIFRKACEKTMKILRKNHVFLTTILEVLLYDPLYVWKWSSQKILDGDRDGESEEKNLTAQRALLRVQDKLEGKEEGKMGTPVVEVQIQRLINEAMNTHNLCRLYPGWDPYL